MRRSVSAIRGVPFVPASMLVTLLLAVSAVTAEAAWQQLETRYTIIKYKNVESLERFVNSIDFGPGGGLFSSFSASDATGLSQGVKQKMDAIFRRVQEILDMPGKIARIAIELHPDKASLDSKYKAITGSACRVRAWYLYETNTVYFNSEDVFDGMVAHELAHAIIDNYLKVRPPRATAEILARYVDTHLKD